MCIMHGNIMTAVLMVATTVSLASVADAATLRMEFADGSYEVTLASTEVVDIYVYLDLLDGDNFIGGYWSNESAPGLVQTTSATPTDGWSADPSGNGYLLGSTTGQQVNVGDNTPLEPEVLGPISVLVAIQTIQPASNAANGDYEVMFDHDTVNLSWFDNAGAGVQTFEFSAEADSTGFYTYGKGSPEVAATKMSPGIDAAPLIVHVKTADGGGGGGADADNDGVPDDQDAFPDDPDETADTDDDGVGDNADDFPDDPDETTDTDDDGTGDNADTDDDDDGVADVVDLDPLDPTVGQDASGSSGGGGVARGPCGMGVIGSMPVGLVGLLLLHSGRKRFLMKVGPE